MAQYDEKPPHMPPGWVAIPADALKRMGAQAMISSLETARMTDPEGYKHHVRTRMFIDVANQLQRVYEPTIEVREGADGERWNLFIWCVDPEYLKAQAQRLKESRSTVMVKPA